MNLRVREAHQDQAFPNQRESARFCVKWGRSGGFNISAADALLRTAEGYWDVMTGQLGFDQTRGLEKEKRLQFKINIYICGTGLQHPGDGCYLGCDPEGVHYCSTSADHPTLAHELGHVAEMGTYGFIDHPQVGWLWECCSQWLLYYFHNDKAPSIMSWLEAHNKPLDNFDCRYDSWLFLYHLQMSFGPGFIGYLWSTAAQNELPFAAIQRALPLQAFPDIFADFAARCTTWDFGGLEQQLRRQAGPQWTRFADMQPSGDGLRPVSRPLHWFGFHVVDLKGHASDQSTAAIEVEVRCRPHPDDWRAAMVIIQADGRTARTCDGWRGSKRQFKASHCDHSIMLVICPAGRHDDKTEPPEYSMHVSSSAQAAGPARAPAPADWACEACTYLHTDQQSHFLACAVCGRQRYAS